MQCLFGAGGQFLRRQQITMLFEFNSPILKKGLWILKDFEKNSTDFEGFATFFEWISNGRRPCPNFNSKMNYPLFC